MKAAALLLASCLPLSAQTASLDGATGHVYRVDAQAKTFELLKATEYDPKTEQGRSRFTVKWTDDTQVEIVTPGNGGSDDFLRIVDKKGTAHTATLPAVFEGIDPRQAKAMSEGKPFFAKVARVHLGTPATQIPCDGQIRANGTLLIAAGKPPAEGVAEVGGKQVQVKLRPNQPNVFVHTKGSPADLAKGFWQATIHGADKDGTFTVSRMEITPLEDPLATDDPKLPRVLIIGDSISMNYIDALKEELRGVANVHRNEGNAASSQGVINMELWLGNYEEKGRHWDVIQFNHGLHDLKQGYDPKTKVWGDYAVAPADYQANLEKEIAILKKTGAKLVFCTTTPVPNSNTGEYARKKGASEIYNKLALEVMAKHPEIRINDLHAAVTASPVFDNWRKTIDVHYYKDEERKALGKAVAEAIRAALADK